MRLLPCVAALLLLTAGCLGSTDPEPTATDSAEETGSKVVSRDQPNLSRVQESWDLSWTQVRIDRGATTDANCIALGNTSASFTVQRGWVNVTWSPGDPNTTQETQLMVRGGEGLDRYENRTSIGAGQHSVNVSGWNLTNPERRLSLLVGFESPEQVYAGVENRATIEVDWLVTGSYETFLEGSCTRT